MAAHPQRDTVLENTELLELILLQLDLRTLLWTQRVCRRWHNVTRSPALQEALFLRPARSTPSATEAEINPLLMLYFPAWFAPRHQWKERYELEATSWTRDPAARDKFLRPEASWKAMLPVQPPPQALRVVTRTHAGGLRVRNGQLVLGGDSVRGRTWTPARDETRSRKRKWEGAEGDARWNGKDVNMGLIYHLAQTYLRERVVSYFCMIYPENAQRVLDAQVEGMLPLSALSVSSPAGADPHVLSNVPPRSVELEETGTSTLTMVFEQLRNWFGPHDPTGDWLEEQNAIFARLNLRGWSGPVIWDEAAIEWQADDEV